MLTFNFVIQLTFIVSEKETKLRESMGQMGLNRYWFKSELVDTNLYLEYKLTVSMIYIGLKQYVQEAF